MSCTSFLVLWDKATLCVKQIFYGLQVLQQVGPPIIAQVEYVPIPAEEELLPKAVGVQGQKGPVKAGELQGF